MSKLEPAVTTSSPEEIARSILHRNSYRSIRSLTCTFHDGVLTIGGRLPSFHLKQVAQAAVQGIQGVVHIENQIEVAQ